MKSYRIVKSSMRSPVNGMMFFVDVLLDGEWCEMNSFSNLDGALLYLKNQKEIQNEPEVVHEEEF